MNNYNMIITQRKKVRCQTLLTTTKDTHCGGLHHKTHNFWKNNDVAVVNRKRCSSNNCYASYKIFSFIKLLSAWR